MIDHPLLIGLVPCPAPGQPWNTATELESLEYCFRETGARLIFSGPTWKELEPTLNQYDFSPIDRYVEFAERYDLPIACDLHMINTNKREMPEELAELPLDHPEVLQRLPVFLKEMFPHFKGRLRWLGFGNEIDSYYSEKPDELPQFPFFLQCAGQACQRLAPEVQVSTCISAHMCLLDDSLRSRVEDILAACDYIHTTYYPAPGIGELRSSQETWEDFNRLIEIAAGKKILLQEVGCPSVALSHSSPERQAEFYSTCFDILEVKREHFIGANFMMLHEWSDALIQEMGKY